MNVGKASAASRTLPCKKDREYCNKSFAAHPNGRARLEQLSTAQYRHRARLVHRRSARQGVTAALCKNAVGIHSLIFPLKSLQQWSKSEAENAISGAKKAGYDLIELILALPDAIDATMVKELLLKYDMKATASLALSAGNDISSDDAEVRERGKKTLRKAIDILKTVGGTHLVGVTYGANNKYPAPCTRQQWNNAVSVLKAVEMVEEIGKPNVVVHFDTYHMNMEENSLEQAVATAGRHLGYVHIQESHRGYLGTGTVDFARFFQALAAIGYSGPITVEGYSAGTIPPFGTNHLCVWHEMWGSSEDMARKSRHFVALHVEAADGLYSPLVPPPGAPKT